MVKKGLEEGTVEGSKWGVKAKKGKESVDYNDCGNCRPSTIFVFLDISECGYMGKNCAGGGPLNCETSS